MKTELPAAIIAAAVQRNANFMPFCPVIIRVIKDGFAELNHRPFGRRMASVAEASRA
jgi:hypothetical protein